MIKVEYISTMADGYFTKVFTSNQEMDDWFTLHTECTIISVTRT